MSRQTISFEDSSSSRVADFPSRFSSAKDLATTSSAPGAPAEEEGEEEEEDNERKEKEERGFLGRPRERLRNICVPKKSRQNFPVLLLLLFLLHKSCKKVNFLFRVFVSLSFPKKEGLRLLLIILLAHFVALERRRRRRCTPPPLLLLPPRSRCDP